MNSAAYTDEDRSTVNLAIGRILRLGGRPEQAGDVADYERCKALIMATIGEPADRKIYAPLPGWNFGSGASGCVE